MWHGGPRHGALQFESTRKVDANVGVVDANVGVVDANDGPAVKPPDLPPGHGKQQAYSY